jgi:hypothetical protein
MPITDTDSETTLAAYRTTRAQHIHTQLVLFCPNCLAWHFHSGRRNEKGAGDGYRKAHCSSSFKYGEPAMPSILETGYILREVGEITREIVARYLCRRGMAFTRPTKWLPG